jgi:hypothetical protein
MPPTVRIPDLVPIPRAPISREAATDLISADYTGRGA